ncbi:MAG TPA: NfeD family protein, partial [Desulfopila sp.]|nr:NfeD family protein [Desulfopila sp.]
LGSATPVMMGGLPGAPAEKDSFSSPAGDGKSKEQKKNGEKEAGDSAGKEQGGSAMERKTMEDAVAYIRELAGRHGRNADWAERAVREAVNLGAAGALEKNVIDIVAADVDDLLAQMDGRSVVMEGGEKVLDTDGMQVVRHDPDWRTRLLSVITDPNIAYFLMLIGFYGIFFELVNPGSLFPGVIGGICLILALFAFQVLSVNYAGLALILLGLGFIVAEAFLPSFGILGIGGIASFVVGSIILMDGSNLSVSLPMIGGTALVAAAFLLWALSRFISLRKRHSVSGLEQTTRQKAAVLEDFEDEEDQYRGAVRLAGERWKAVSKEPLEKGDVVRVERIDGLTVYVVKSL